MLTGDFNEPSHLEWTEAAVAAGKCPLAVDWPATRAIAGAGLIDAFRACAHDRIDFVFAGGAGVKVVSAEVVGEEERRADLVVRPWPSDHRAVVATVEL